MKDFFWREMINAHLTGHIRLKRVNFHSKHQYLCQTCEQRSFGLVQNPCTRIWGHEVHWDLGEGAQGAIGAFQTAPSMIATWHSQPFSSTQRPVFLLSEPWLAHFVGHKFPSKLSLCTHIPSTCLSNHLFCQRLGEKQVWKRFSHPNLTGKHWAEKFPSKSQELKRLCIKMLCWKTVHIDITRSEFLCTVGSVHRRLTGIFANAFLRSKISRGQNISRKYCTLKFAHFIFVFKRTILRAHYHTPAQKRTLAQTSDRNIQSDCSKRSHTLSWILITRLDVPGKEKQRQYVLINIELTVASSASHGGRRTYNPTKSKWWVQQ